MSDALRISIDHAVAKAVLRELERAREKFPPMASAHEGYAVILEELEELWDEVKCNRAQLGTMEGEAIQVAAMAIRFVTDVCGGVSAARDGSKA